MPSSRPGTHPVTITIDAAHPRQVVPADFAGLSFERGPGDAGVSRNLFTPVNNSLITLFRNLGLGSLRIGGARWIWRYRRAWAVTSPGSTTCLRSPPWPG
jgi:hypothetical protein